MHHFVDLLNVVSIMRHHFAHTLLNIGHILIHLVHLIVYLFHQLIRLFHNSGCFADKFLKEVLLKFMILLQLRIRPCLILGYFSVNVVEFGMNV